MEMASRHPYHGMPGGLGGGMPMPMYAHSHSPFGPSMGMQMPMPVPMHPAMNSMIGIPPHDPMGLMGMNMVPSMGMPYPGLAGLNPMTLNMGSGLHPSMFEPRRRRRHYDDLYSGLGRGSSRYLDSYDLFDDIFDDGGMYADDYDDIDDPLMLWMRMARGGGGGRRGGRRGRYGRYGAGLGYDRY